MCKVKELGDHAEHLKHHQLHPAWRFVLVNKPWRFIARPLWNQLQGGLAVSGGIHHPSINAAPALFRVSALAEGAVI
jgi:hypothetical protein